MARRHACFDTYALLALVAYAAGCSDSATDADRTNRRTKPVDLGVRIDDEPDMDAFAFNLSGLRWPSTDVSFSYMPDGTVLDSYRSVLFAELDAVAPTATWQREFARALQTWAVYSPLNFRLVPDDGTPKGVFGAPQGDARFGDIRFESHAGSGYLAYAYGPTMEAVGYTSPGDISLNASNTFFIGRNPDIYSTILHESGHALGLSHSSTAGSVMYAYLSSVALGLTSDDIGGIQAIYGSRQHDAYDAVASNDARDAASKLSTLNGAVTIRGDLTTLADVDHYVFTAPNDATGRLDVSLDASKISLLAPKLSVYSQAGVLLVTASADYGKTASATLTGIAPGQALTVAVDGASADVFGMGAYFLAATFTVGVERSTDTTAPTVSIDSPLDDQSVSGPVTITATAADDVGVTLVEFYRVCSGCSPVLIGVDGSSPYTYDWDASGLSPGSTSILARAFDASGNMGESATVTFTRTSVVDTTPPAVAIASPASSAVVAGRVDILATATDGVGVASVSFYVDEVLVGTDTQSPYGWSWSSTAFADGPHVLTARAVDIAKNSSTSMPVTVTVSNTGSSEDITPPSAPSGLVAVKKGAGKKVAVSLSWGASTDEVGVAGYHVYRNGGSVPIATVALPSYADRSPLRGQTSTYVVKAFDAAGNLSGASNEVKIVP